MKHRLQPVSFLFVLATMLSACGMGGSSPARESTVDAISAVVRATASAVAAQNQNPNAPVETAQAQGTASAELAAVTQAAESGLSDEARAATATAIAPILAELPKFDVDPTAGRMGWVHPPESLEVDGYMQYDYVNRFIATVAADFVVSADITWNTQYGTSGCGFVLRSDGNEDALDQYMVIMTRGASGHVLFATMVDGDVVTGRDIYAYGRDPNFNWENGATNRFTVVGRGNRFFIYTNDTLIGEVDPSAPLALPGLPDEPPKPANVNDPVAMALYQQQLAQHDAVVAQINADYRARQNTLANSDTEYERGFVAMVVLSESGRSQCQFDNAWLWLMN